MPKFYVLQPGPEPSAWPVVVEGSHSQTFSSRQAALTYVIRECRAAERHGAAGTIISIQGTDGRWRHFDSCLLPVHDGDDQVAP